MEQIMKLANNPAIISAIITGVITFLITRYNYQKNLPTDKLEIAYNRIYYPILQLLPEKKIDKETVNKIKTYLDKYKKYANPSTLKAFEPLEKYHTSSYVYENFKRNIKKEESYLRRRLGYLEANIYVMYKYSDKLDKRAVKAYLGLGIVYFFMLANSLIETFPHSNYIVVFRVIYIISLIFTLCEASSLLVITLYRKYKTRKSIHNNRQRS